MADKTTTTFPKMGTSMSRAVNRSGQPSKNTKTVPKKNSKGGKAEPATASHRTGQLERLGFKGAPQATMSYPTAPEAGQTYRNVKLVPSSVGNRDFYDRRKYGQTGTFG